MSFFWEVTLRESVKWTAKLEANFNFPEWKPLIRDESPWTTVAQVDSPGYGTKGNQLNASALWYKLFSVKLHEDIAMLLQNTLAFNFDPPPASSALVSTYYSDPAAEYLLFSHRSECPREHTMGIIIKLNIYTPPPKPRMRPETPSIYFVKIRRFELE